MRVSIKSLLLLALLVLACLSHAVAEDHQLHYDKDGHLVDEHNHGVDVHKKEEHQLHFDGQGHLVDEHNHPVDSSLDKAHTEHHSVHLDSHGHPVDELGHPVDEFGHPIHLKDGHLVDDLDRPVDEHGHHLNAAAALPTDAAHIAATPHPDPHLLEPAPATVLPTDKSHHDADLSLPPDQTNVADAKLAAPDSPSMGVVSSTPMLMDGPAHTLKFVGKDHKTVFAITDRHHVFRSVDAGFSWASQASKFESSSGVLSLHISPADSNTIFFMGNEKTHWITRDLGETVDAVRHTERLLEVNMHPTQSGWLLAAAMSPQCDEAPPTLAPTDEPTDPTAEAGLPKPTPEAPVGCNRQLLLTQDFGKTWKVILEYVVQFAWAPRGRPDHLIFATALRNKKGQQQFGVWNPDTDFISSADFFKTHDVIMKHANRMLFSRYFLFVATVNPTNAAHVTLHVNRNNATTHEFEKLVLPVDLTQHSYSLLDSSEGSVFLHINHLGEDSRMGMVYASDASGVFYSLSLPNNRRNANGMADFEKVDGIEGIYMANFIEETHKDVPPSEGMTEQSQLDTEKTGVHVQQLTKTVISFDKGAEWVYLHPPEEDVHGKKYDCTGCHLHLNGITSTFGPFYTNGKAIGLILGTGNVGAHLHEDMDRMNTYLSRDAGQTWFEIAQGSHIYELGNHGGIILMANNHAAVTSVMYSLDEGLTWLSHTISEQPVHVDNIIVDPSTAGQVFLIYGRAEDAGVIIQLDFRRVHERACVGAEAPGTSASDFEEWTPSDGRSKSCLLGHTITYVRRKRDHKCFHDDNHAPQLSYAHCACTDFNFECDFGFKREFTTTGETGACVPDPESQHHSRINQVPDKCEGFYLATRGYRRVAGDTCVGGAEFLPVLTPCPVNYTHSTSAGTVLLVLLTLVVVALCVMTAGQKIEPLRNLLAGAGVKFNDVSYGQLSSSGAAPSSSISSADRRGGSLLGASRPDSMMDDDDFGLDEEVGAHGARTSSSSTSASSSSISDDVDSGIEFSSVTKASTPTSIPKRSFAPLPPPAQKDVKIPILQPHSDDGFGNV